VTQRKSEMTKRRIDRDFLTKSRSDSGRRPRRATDGAMHKFCYTRSISYKTRSDSRREPMSDYVRFCFGDPTHADAFMTEFGGDRITIEPAESW
jgi:hypothetical protein